MVLLQKKKKKTRPKNESEPFLELLAEEEKKNQVLMHELLVFNTLSVGATILVTLKATENIWRC